MRSPLIKLRAEAQHRLEVYTEHKDSPDELLRRRAHLQLDRFLMEHREEATLLMLEGLDAHINNPGPVKKVHLLSRVLVALRGRV